MCLPTLSNETIKMSRPDHSKALSTTSWIVPTFPVETAPQHIDVSGLTSSDLASLKRDDPFMYYSIPSAKNAALHCKDDSLTDLQLNLTGYEMESARNSSTKISVTRQRRISMECHPVLLMEELFSDKNFMVSSQDVDSYSDDGDDLYDYLISLDETRGQ